LGGIVGEAIADGVAHMTGPSAGGGLGPGGAVPGVSGPVLPPYHPVGVPHKAAPIGGLGMPAYLPLHMKKDNKGFDFEVVRGDPHPLYPGHYQQPKPGPDYLLDPDPIVDPVSGVHFYKKVKKAYLGY